MSEDPNRDPRVYFAAERTFLAWIRTSLALMGFGFVVARFGIFLRQIVMDRGESAPRSSGISVVLGILLVATGVVVCIATAWRHVQLVRALQKGETLALRPSTLAIALALVLAAVGLLMAVYLLHSRNMAGQQNQKGPMMQSQNESGIISQPSARPVDETVARLKTLLEERNITLFALIDHSGEAAKAGLKMPPTKLLIFGNPKAGTPVMLASPDSAIDLPLKLLVREDADGKTWISYNDPTYLKQRHHLPPEVIQALAAAGILAEQGAQ